MIERTRAAVINPSLDPHLGRIVAWMTAALGLLLLLRSIAAIG